MDFTSVVRYKLKKLESQITNIVVIQLSIIKVLNNYIISLNITMFYVWDVWFKS